MKIINGGSQNLAEFHERIDEQASPLAPVIPVKGGAKFPPLLSDWPNATRETLESLLASNPDANRALRLDHYLVLDPDNEAAVDFLESLENAGKLPPTVTYKTWRGFTQRVYNRIDGQTSLKIAAHGIKLEIRTGKGQYVLLPPSEVNGSKYRFEPHLSPTDVDIADLPMETLQELQGMANRNKGKPGESRDSGKQTSDLNKLNLPTWANNLIESGKLGGHPSRSERDHAVIGALKRTGCDLDTIETIFANNPIGDKYFEKGSHGRAYLAESFLKVQGKPDEGGDSSPNRILWPEWVMSGAAGKFARAYAEYLETPHQFLYMSYLTILGHLISGKITLYSELKPQPRLYTVLLGESADTRKSTAINKTREFFMETLLKDKLNLILGIGSAEGMAKALDRNHRGLLIFDEFKAFVQKCKIDSSVLLPCINSLFENNDYQNLTQERQIYLNNAHVSILAASTIQTYQNMFTSRFSDIGFTNRLFLVLGDSNRRFAIPQQIPFELKEELKRDLYQVNEYVEATPKGECFPLPIADEALSIFENWYHNQEQSVFTKRLDTYGHRLMLLLAINERQYAVTAEVANKVVALLNYQLAARREADPIDADNAIARLEERIRRSLKNGPLSKRELERKCNKSKFGNWLWSKAIENLLKADEIGMGKSYFLKG